MRNPKKNEISGLERFAQSGESDGFSSVFVVGNTNFVLCCTQKEKVSNFDAVKVFSTGECLPLLSFQTNINLSFIKQSLS